MTYTKEFLIDELHRFVRENGRVPTARDISPKFGYPSYMTYYDCFESFNNALEIANLKINKKHHIGELDGSETCTYCGCNRNETSGWRYVNNVRYCDKHGANGVPDYIIGNLNINSSTGLGRAGEILVAKTLKIANEFDCNRISCHSSVDLYNEKYGKIDVKTCMFNYKYNYWTFSFKAKKIADTYICLGLSSNRSNVKHVWIVPNESEIRDLQSFTVRNTQRSLFTRLKYKVDSKHYNDTWKSMKLDNCKIMTDKNKEEKQKYEVFKKAYAKKLGLKEID